MSNPRKSIRVNLLASATIIAIAAISGSAFAAEKANVRTLSVDTGVKYDRFIVKYKNGSSESLSVNNVKNSVQKFSATQTVAGKAIRLSHLRRTALGSDVVKAGRKMDRAEAETFMRELATNPNVEYVEVDRLNKISYTPNDSRFNEQWGYTGTYGIKATQAWDQATGAGIVVAVLDTGITNHSDLNANVLPGYDFIADASVGNDGNGRDSDPSDPGDSCNGQRSSWHGTHVAGTVAAVANNAKGVAGTAFNSKIVPVRVLGTCGGYDSDIADAIVWASGGSVSGVPANQNPAEVSNLSLGGSGACGTTTQNAINGAVGRGATVVIAAGNDNLNVSNASPANCNNVIAVGANDSAGKRSIWGSSQQSNYGALVDVSAPGTNILSTLNSGSNGPASENYVSYGGTSMATPHVAGVVALVQSVSNPIKTPAQIEALLKSTVTPFPSTPDKPIGAGIVNAKAAVDAAKGTTPPPIGGSTLTKGVPVTGLSGAAGSEKIYTIDVPSGASNLMITMSGGTGDADLYVRAGSAPTDSTYDCRPYKTGNAESCTIATPTAGKYYVRMKAYSAYSGVSLVADYVTGSNGGGVQTYTNTSDVSIADNTTVTSTINVSGRSGNASSSSRVAVAIVHTYIGDLKVDLVAPDGSVYALHNRSGGSADNINTTYTVNLSSEALNGAWKLRVSDSGNGDTGKIDSWSLTF